ncbi:TetR/AcrR family transcriptional regulator [Actinomadura craniellae]|uniref:TetR/AcrR family transcriptional regulator n=1 Tax=Actinomadura craniellae TaxID=2231787 RepID=A0A365H8G4_9ACTN|nr:TetR/AcrR family transcriptional regulator [Actinomadura craniellae]RAY14553.1 TetR/AcrR family transcriptional regulator [Actinomadura craniellae]
MRNRGWRGEPPSDDDEARERIIAAAMRCIDRHGAAKTGLADVAAELGVTRQTVYRLFPSAEDLFQAMAVSAADTFIDRMAARVSGFTEPAEMLVECLAFTLERLHQERHLSALFVREQAHITRQFTSATPSELTRTLMARLPVDWHALGIDRRRQDQIVEIYLRTLQSFVIDPGPPRSPDELRAFLRLWLAPAIRVPGPDRLGGEAGDPGDASSGPHERRASGRPGQ